MVVIHINRSVAAANWSLVIMSSHVKEDRSLLFYVQRNVPDCVDGPLKSKSGCRSNGFGVKRLLRKGLSFKPKSGPKRKGSSLLNGDCQRLVQIVEDDCDFGDGEVSFQESDSSSAAVYDSSNYSKLV